MGRRLNALQQIQFSYYETESHLHNALESVSDHSVARQSSI
jgi:hypothetical protein